MKSLGKVTSVTPTRLFFIKVPNKSCCAKSWWCHGWSWPLIGMSFYWTWLDHLRLFSVSCLDLQTVEKEPFIARNKKTVCPIWSQLQELKTKRECASAAWSWAWIACCFHIKNQNDQSCSHQVGFCHVGKVVSRTALPWSSRCAALPMTSSHL